MNIEYWASQENYDVEWVKKVYGSPSVTLQQLQRSEIPSEGSVRVTYSTKDGFKKTAKALGLMDDFKVLFEYSDRTVTNRLPYRYS